MEENNKELQTKGAMENAEKKESVKKEPAKRKATSTKTTAGTKKTSSAKKTSSTTTKRKTTTTSKTTANKKDTKPVKSDEPKEKLETKEIKKSVTSENAVKPATETKNEMKKTEDAKKVEDKKKFEPVKKVEKKKKHTGLKFVLILIIIAIVLFLVHYLRNYIIVSKIFNERAKYKDVTNYSYCNTQNDGEDAVKTEYYKKDNTAVIFIKNRNFLVWSNKDLNQSIILNYDKMEAIVRPDVFLEGTIDSTPVDNGVAVLGMFKDAQMYKGFSFVYFITSEKINGVDCYKVSIGKEKAWYSKENGMLVKYINGSLNADYSDWKFNEVKDEDVARPNLMGFSVENKINQ